MIEKRIEKRPSCTAAMTCMCRAASYLEKKDNYQSNDHLSVKILPNFFRGLFSIPFCRKFFVRFLAPAGVYEYVIARTKYIDAVYERALMEGFNQILLFGAGYDTRAWRFQGKGPHTRIFELDSPHTQQAKIKQFRKCNLGIPSNGVFIAVDFDKESLSSKLDASGFEKNMKSLFVLEGLVMYLESQSVDATFRIIREYAGAGSRIVFDYVLASVIRYEDRLYGEKGIVKSVSKAGEKWRFGIEPSEITSFIANYDFNVSDHKCADELEKTYFQDTDGRPVGRVNGTHCIVTAEKSNSTV